MTDINDPQDLVGAELSAVCFVRDYTEFHFDGSIVLALGTVGVRQHTAVVLTECHPGWRDALCATISRALTRLHIVDGDSIAMYFGDGSTIWISLREDERLGPESAHFLPEIGKPLQVW
jgi:hypothetical protein